MVFENSLSFALHLDAEDQLKQFRNRFFIPKKDGKELIYFNGNSLGLQPKSVSEYIQTELNDWALLAAYGHMQAKHPWITYHKILKKGLAALTGSKLSEVTAMNSLTTNLHLLMVSFYRPTPSRFKIIIEKGAFSSDLYAFETQVKYHGFKPEEAIIELSPKENSFVLETHEILKVIEENKNEIALIVLGGVNFYTGQAFNIKEITEAGHRAGAFVGFDLAHAIGNIKLNLHDWKVDFAVWCTYKYLNSGPGGVGGAFVHERFGNDKSIPRFAGWWGYTEEDRFKMQKGFEPMEGVDGWQLSNVPVMLMAVHKASLDIFIEAGMDNLLIKSALLTGYLEFLVNKLADQFPYFKVITPTNAQERGCQLSLYFNYNSEEIFQNLSKAGMVTDMRRPNVIRVTPVPLYNTFQEIFEFGRTLEHILKTLPKK